MSNAEYQPRCHSCGRFIDPSAVGVSGRLAIPQDYWNGPEGEQYRCAGCTEIYGPMRPGPSGLAAEHTAWVNRPSPKEAP